MTQGPMLKVENPEFIGHWGIGHWIQTEDFAILLSCTKGSLTPYIKGLKMMDWH